MDLSPANKRFEPLNLAAGPRDLPAWVKGAHIDWMDGYGNSPHLKVRCAADPLGFSDFGNPAWEKVGADCWIAERDGVASVHYHSGAVRPTEFTRKIGGEWDPTKPQLLDGRPWIDTAGLWPDQIANAKPKMGGLEHETFTMLATTQQDGYAGRHFDITLKDGTNVRLRGPWHSLAPKGFVSLYYDTDDHIQNCRSGWRVWRQRKWHELGGFFGLYVRTELVLDIFASFQPHAPWATIIETRKDGERRWIEPMRPETQMPKGWYVEPEGCPGHRYSLSSGEPKPYDSCVFCHERRDPAWRFPHEQAA
jgi:hypothetical protein